MTRRTKKSLPKHGIFLGRKIRPNNEVLGIIFACATLVHFLLTVESDSELEFDGLLCIVTRAIVYPTKRTRFTILNNIFFFPLFKFFSTVLKISKGAPCAMMETVGGDCKLLNGLLCFKNLKNIPDNDSEAVRSLLIL